MGAEPPTGTRVRVLVWALLGGTSLSFMLTRLSLPQLIPMMIADAGMSEVEKGLLLGSFFPGYVFGMTPSGVLARAFGAKRVLTVGLLGNAAGMMLLPLAAARGVRCTSALLILKGLCQSCLESTHSTLKRAWMPPALGSQRVWAMRVTRWGQFMGQLIASIISEPSPVRKAGQNTATNPPKASKKTTPQELPEAFPKKPSDSRIQQFCKLLMLMEQSIMPSRMCISSTSS